jgi:cysteine desulfurase
MLPWLKGPCGNAASMHWAGQASAKAVATAREQVAELIGAEAKAMVFTSGATESVNLAVQGVAEFAHSHNAGNHIITCQTEHPASLETCEALAEKGFKLTVLPVDAHGLVDPEAIRAAITEQTMLINIMFANNEVGTIHDISAIGAIAREHEILFHCDASQAAATEKIDVDAMHIDLLSLSAHKMYGPQGTGALFLRRRRPRVRLAAPFFGGGHELEVRPGTLNVPGIVGMGAACNIARMEREALHAQLTALRKQLADQLTAGISDLVINGHPSQGLPGNLNVTIPGVDSRKLLPHLIDHLAISSGSACTSALPSPSHVLLAMGIGGEAARQSYRFGLGRSTSSEEINAAAARMVDAVARIKK